MANYLIQDSTLTNIANSIRNKTGKSEPILTENMSAEIDSITGGGGGAIVLETNANTCKQMFDGCAFQNDELHLTVKSTTDSYGYMFRRVKGLKKLKMTFTTTKESDFTIFCNTDIEEITFVNMPAVKNATQMFADSKKLRVINGELAFSEAVGETSLLAFSYCTALETVRFKPNGIPKSTSFEQSDKLTPESIQSIIDGLATVAEPQTLTLHPTIKAKLTPEQTQAITAKNWILA